MEEVMEEEADSEEEAMDLVEAEATDVLSHKASPHSLLYQLVLEYRRYVLFSLQSKTTSFQN